MRWVRLLPRPGTMVKGMLNALAEDILDAWLPLRTGAVAMALEYIGRCNSGDAPRGVGNGNEDNDTSPGEGGGLLFASSRARRGFMVNASLMFAAELNGMFSMFSKD